MTKEELIDLVREIMNPRGKSEKELDILMSTLERHVPHPEVSDLIYYEENTPEEVIEKALSYKIVLLPSPKEDDSLPN